MSSVTGVFVSGLPAQTTDQMFQELFSQFGTIHSVRIMREVDGTPRGYGFVNFADTDAAAKAIQAEGLTLLGQPLTVKYSQKREELEKTSLFVGNLPANATNEEVVEKLATFLANHGVKVPRVDVHTKENTAYAFLRFTAFEDAEKALSHLRQCTLTFASGQVVPTAAFSRGSSSESRGPYDDRLERAQRTLYVSGLPASVNNDDGTALRQKFSLYGTVTRLNVMRTSAGFRGVAFVEFERAAQAREAIRVLNGTMFEGHVLSIQMSKPRVPTALPTTLAANPLAARYPGYTAHAAYYQQQYQQHYPQQPYAQTAAYTHAQVQQPQQQYRPLPPPQEGQPIVAYRPMPGEEPPVLVYDEPRQVYLLLKAKDAEKLGYRQQQAHATAGNTYGPVTSTMQRRQERPRPEHGPI
ncbi:MAG: hypothetical protein MHM6MM_005908 [Cercozoa sp. M6MM]